MVVVSIQHLGGHRLAEAAAAADATELALGEECPVNHADESRLIDVLTVPCALESCITYINICTHNQSICTFCLQKYEKKREPQRIPAIFITSLLVRLLNHDFTDGAVAHADDVQAALCGAGLTTRSVEDLLDLSTIVNLDGVNSCRMVLVTEDNFVG